MKISYSSERLDMFSEDFALTAKKSGTRSLTVALEGASPRSRHIMNKNLSEEQVLKAFEIIFKLGFQKVKIYNISNYPFEQEEDRMYYVNIVTKLKALKEKYSAKTQLRFSWTPFQPKSFTPFQWAPLANIDIIDGQPSFRKTFTAALAAIKEADPDVRVRFGTDSNVGLFSQVLAMGDRRLYPVVMGAWKSPNINYFGGMGIGAKKEAIEELSSLIKSTGLSWEYFLREKSADEVFPWDHLTVGTDKSWLRMIYEKAKAASETPVDQEGLLREPCYKSCTVCGVCRSKERPISDMWPEDVYGPGRSLPKFKWGDHAADQIDVNTALDGYVKLQKLKVLRVELSINPAFRYVDPSKIKFRLRRACFRADIPVKNELTAASSKILDKAWFAGRDIYELYIADKSYSEPAEVIVKKINAELQDEAFIVTRADWYSDSVTGLKNNFEYVLYSLTFKDTVLSPSALQAEISRFDKADSYIVKVKVKSTTQRDKITVQNIEAKSLVYKVFVRDNKDGTHTLFAALSENLAIYDFAATLFKTSKRNLYKYPAIVEEYLIRDEASSLDMFADVCESCGEQVELNIWGESFGSKCLKCLYLEDFVPKKFSFVISDETLSDEEEEDVPDELGGHDDDEVADN